MKRPRESACASLKTPVFKFLADTLADGTGTPDVVVTDPLRVATATWAGSGCEITNEPTQRASVIHNNLIRCVQTAPFLVQPESHNELKTLDLQMLGLQAEMYGAAPYDVRTQRPLQVRYFGS